MALTRDDFQKAGAETVANRFGFVLRDEPLGFFLAPFTRDRFGHRQLGDDAVLVKRNGEIVLYQDSAQAFYAAKQVAALILAD